MSIWMSFVNFSMSQTLWDVLDFSNKSAQAAGAPQASCRPTAHPLYIHFRYVIMDVIPNFAIPQMQWDGLEISNHPVQAAYALQVHCRLTAHPWYIHLNMSIWMVIINFSISQMQWDGLKLSYHAVQAECLITTRRHSLLLMLTSNS